MVDQSYIGGGKFHLNGRFIGNVPTLVLSFEADSQDLPDYTSPGGGLYNSLERVSSVGFEFSFNDYSAENLAMALFGSYANVAAGTVAAEPHTSSAEAGDRFIKTLKTIDMTDVPGTVIVDTDPAGAPFTLNTDYTVSPGGITVLGSGNIGQSTALLISYDNQAVDLVQALVNSGQEFHMVFDGFNDAQSGTPVVVEIYRGKPSTPDGVPLIGTEFAENTVTGKILKDLSIVGQGLSQYYTVAVVKPAA